MFQIYRLYPSALSVEAAVSAFLDVRLSHPENRRTQRTCSYSSTLRMLAANFSGPLTVLEEDDDAVLAWFTARWRNAQPATWNRHLDAIRAAGRYWREMGWLASDPTHGIAPRRLPGKRTRAFGHSQVEELLSRPGVALRERTLWQLLYETAARPHEVLALDAEDLDLGNRRATVRRKGGAKDWIYWRTGTARLLPRLLRGRNRGPLFVASRRARVHLAADDLEDDSGRARLSYRRAAEIFEQAAPGGWTLHQLRHVALTHTAEDGANDAALT